MNKQEVIETLEKKRKQALDNFEYYRDKENEKYENMNRARVDSYNLAIRLFEQLDEPQAELVEIPQFLADYFNDNPNLSIGWLLGFDVLYWDDEDEVAHWLYGNDIAENNKRYLIACKAYVKGYTVEQQKRWVVKANNFGIYFTSFRPETLSGIFGTKKCARTFTDRAKAEAVATLVEGSVEEV